MSTDTTSHREDLTRARARLRSLHQATTPKDELNYRGHTLEREPQDKTQSGCYQIFNADSEPVDTVEPSDFHNADDFVRYVDLVIQHGRDRAKDWLRNELYWGWTDD